jgi:glycosyltransferase involved in cell wall biosynthesis
MSHGIFVTYRGFLEAPTGGVQICTREYVDVIRATGFDLVVCPFDTDRRISTRVARRLFSSAYFRPAEPGLVQRIARIAAAQQPDAVFLNQANLAGLAPVLRRVLPPGFKIVLLSHGLESTDMLHLARMRQQHLPLSGRLSPTPAVAIGVAVAFESRSRNDIDLVCALSPFDMALEQLIGARAVIWIPRTIRPCFLDWRPSGDRLGFIGTLDHAPNLEGLVLALEALPQDARPFRIRVAGGPPRLGQWLAHRFNRVDYLGPLADDALTAEAATWNAFMHPIFCFPRGCSIKLATAIGWALPIVTTTPGCRGYEWREGGLVIADEPERFAAECLSLLDRHAASRAREGVLAIARSSPTSEENASRLRATISLPPDYAEASPACDVEC